jgi:hypothetical protein
MDNFQQLTFRVKTVHHPTYELQLVLQTEVYEIGIDKHAIWWYKGSVMRQK